MEYKEIISNKLKEIRQSKRMSIDTLSNKCGLPSSGIYYYENGRSINLDQLQKLCNGLGIDMFTFLDECKREMAKYKKG